MKKDYSTAEVQIVRIDAEDIIRTSDRLPDDEL